MKAIEINVHRPRYQPTPAEIAAECLLIRQGWSERETKLRAGIDPAARMTVPEGHSTVG